MSVLRIDLDIGETSDAVKWIRRIGLPGVGERVPRKRKPVEVSDFRRALGMRIETAAETVGGKRSLAQKAGLNEDQLYRYIRGENAPSVEVINAIAHASGVNVGWLAAGEGQASPSERSAEFGGLVPVENVPLERAITWLREWWAHATPDERAWMRIQLERTFPELAAWQKKQEQNCERSHGA